MQQQQQGPQVDISATTPLTCECGNETFKEAMYLRKESRLMSGLPEDRLVPIQLLAYHLSINRNINPDKPKNLAKVVTVE